MKHLNLLYNSPLLLSLSIVLLCFSFTAISKDNRTCGIEPGKPLTNAYGPWDFTNPMHEEKLGKVIRAHFTTQVERLIDGQSASIAHDIDYTLRAIPNYHKALLALAKKERINGYDRNFYNAACYFKRAIYFQPQDAVTRMLFGSHLHMIKDFIGALRQYNDALAIAPNYIEIHYNIALTYIELAQFEKAFEHAEVAYQRAYPLEGLKDKLKKHGYYSGEKTP